MTLSLGVIILLSMASIGSAWWNIDLFDCRPYSISFFKDVTLTFPGLLKILLGNKGSIDVSDDIF